MTEEQLRSVKNIKLEINRIENALISNKGNSIAHQEYAELLQSRKEDLIKKKIEIEQYISTIKDAEIRLIISLKFIDLKSWGYIAKTLHYDRSTIYYKFKNFLKK